MIQASMVNEAWVSTNGIISASNSKQHLHIYTRLSDHKLTDDNGGDIALVRGLGVAYSRGVVASAVQADVEAFLSVQVRPILAVFTPL